MSDPTTRNEEEITPYGEILSRVEQYSQNPQLATKENMQMLFEDLKDLRSVIDDDGTEQTDGGLRVILESMGGEE